jgi:hypothetical protein
MAERRIYLNHFRAAGIDGFHVLLIAPTGQRRDAIRRAFQQKDATTFRTDVWRFAAHTDIAADTLLTKEIWHPCGSGAAEMLPAIGTGVRPRDAADPEKIERDRGLAGDSAAAGDLASGTGGDAPGGGRSIAEAAEQDVQMLE